MKKLLFFILFSPFIMLASSFDFKTFSSDFSEKIYDSDSTQIATIKGKIYIKKPKYLRMDIISPQKQIMIIRDDSAMIFIKKSNQITYSQLSNKNAWLIPSNILFNTDSMFKINTTNDTITLTPKDSIIPMDSITINRVPPIKFINIYTKDQILKFSFFKQKMDKKLNSKLFIFLRDTRQ